MRIHTAIWVIQPVNVRKISTTSTGSSRRTQAQGSGHGRAEEIPAIVININDNDSAVLALIENLQREDLNYLEEAEGYSSLINEHGLTQEDLARKIGKSQSTVANKIRLLRLPPLVKKILSDNNLTERHARALLKLHDEQLQLKVLRIVCEKGLNVKRTEELIERVIDKYLGQGRDEDNQAEKKEKKLSKTIKDIRIFVNTIRQAIDLMKKSGVNARAAQFDRGEYIEFIVRVPKI